jgi:pimeloyl-ACP methyl ester carboxylesterase
MRTSAIEFPVGYETFHKERVYNFQLNRWYSLGYARYEDMEKAGQLIETFADWKSVMIKLAEESISDNRLLNAAFYFRAAEFYTPPGDADKMKLYDRFVELFYNAVENGDLSSHQIPYENGYLNAIRLPSVFGEKKGTIILHGGFDSFAEESYSMMKNFSESGYDIIVFDGPGQGGSRRKSGLVFDWQWEKPAKAILDFFDLDDVSWIGISMGGWLCFRAAAFEPRIKRVVASSVAYDYLKAQNPAAQIMAGIFLRYFRNMTNNLMIRQQKKDKTYDWWASNLMYMTGKESPIEALDILLQLNGRNLHSELVKQDVLILTGKEDHFCRPKMHDMQIKALTGAKSITGRIFTRDEEAQNHCQIGNIGLALKEITEWIQQKT